MESLFITFAIFLILYAVHLIAGETKTERWMRETKEQLDHKGDRE